MKRNHFAAHKTLLYSIRYRIHPGGNYTAISKLRIVKYSNKTLENGTYREVHVVELVDEGLHPGFILFVDWFVHLKHGRPK